MASQAREALKDVQGVESAVVDTTGRGIFRITGEKPDEEAINAALQAKNKALKVRGLEKTKLELPAAIVKVRLDGFG
jgi:hypothetical protein